MDIYCVAVLIKIAPHWLINYQVWLIYQIKTVTDYTLYFICTAFSSYSFIKLKLCSRMSLIQIYLCMQGILFAWTIYLIFPTILSIIVSTIIFHKEKKISYRTSHFKIMVSQQNIPPSFLTKIVINVSNKKIKQKRW